MTFVDELYKLEISQIVYIQDKLFFYEKFLESVSEIVHPTSFVFYIIPLLAALKTSAYTRVLITAVATEYINITLKWILSAYRPYWWVQETAVYKANRPFLRQTRLTCETTSGLPSGHLMFASAILYIMIRELFIELKRTRNVEDRYIKRVIWFGFGLILTVLTLSRMYFACHFLHQCICGGLLGVGVVELIGSETLQRKLINLRRRRALLFATGLTGVIFAFYWVKKLMGSDPQWSIRMAFKWCDNPLFVKADTTPMYGMSRDFGIFFGLAVSSPLCNCFQTPLNYKKSLVAIITCITLERILNYAVPTHMGFIVYYASIFLINLIFPYLYIVVVPKLCGDRRHSKCE